jgi:hypothetical protein
MYIDAGAGGLRASHRAGQLPRGVDVERDRDPGAAAPPPQRVSLLYYILYIYVCIIYIHTPHIMARP